MKRFSRIALLAAGALLTVLVAALLAVNLYVQSHGTQARIQRELSERLGATLRIQRISVTPWWGLKLTGITMPESDDPGAGVFLQAQTFRLRVRLGSLFAQRLVITEISLVKPKVVWAQNADGKWRLPMSLHAGEAQPAAPEDPVNDVATAQATVARPAPPAVDEASTVAPEPAPFTPEVRRVNLVDGSFRFLDSNRKPVASFEGVRFRSSFRNATALRGTAMIEKTSLRDRFFLEQLQSPLKYDPKELDFSEISARAAGGQITGRFRMRPGEVDSPFSVMVKFHELDADRLIADAHGPSGMLHGRIEGHLEASGKTADQNALNGSGEIQLRDGQVRQYSLLVALGQLLQIDELTQLRFDEAHVKYHIDPGVVTIDELLLHSANFRLSAVGTIGFDGKLQLDSRLAIHDKIRSQLFSAVRDNFEKGIEEGFASLNFKVSGTVERPKSDLMEKLVGPEMKDLSGVISTFLGGGGRSERGKKKRKKEEVAPAVSPAATARAEVAPSEATPSPKPSNAAVPGPDGSP